MEKNLTRPASLEMNPYFYFETVLGGQPPEADRIARPNLIRLVS
jgi:hypothetical protein